jgi:hypothetical protein
VRDHHQASASLPSPPPLLPPQGAAKLVGWGPCSIVVNLLLIMEEHVGPAARSAAPKRSAGAARALLAAAASLGSPAERPHVMEVADFANGMVLDDGSGIAGPEMQQVLGVPGLLSFLAECVDYRLKHSREADGMKIPSIANCLWMLKKVLEEVPAGQLQPLTPQQLERMQLLRMFRQHPLHDATPSQSWTVSSLHPAGLDVLCRSAQLRGDRQLLQRYWAEAGAGHMQVRGAPAARPACAAVWVLGAAMPRVLGLPQCTGPCHLSVQGAHARGACVPGKEAG